MSIWDKLLEIGEVVVEKFGEAMEREQKRKSQYVNKVYKSQERLKTKSSSELVKVAKNNSGPESIAAKLELKERKSSSSLAKKPTSRKTTVKSTSSAHYNPGRRDIKVGFVLSAPGSKEEKAGRPAAGNTGENLEEMLQRWHKTRPDLFISTKRYDYRITNASQTVEYKKKTGRTEASDHEVNMPENIERIMEELAGCEFVICLGAKARKVKSSLVAKGFPGTIASGIHPGWQAINRKYPKLKKDDRIAQAADEVLKQF